MKECVQTHVLKNIFSEPVFLVLLKTKEGENTKQKPKQANKQRKHQTYLQKNQQPHAKPKTKVEPIKYNLLS